MRICCATVIALLAVTLLISACAVLAAEPGRNRNRVEEQGPAYAGDFVPELRCQACVLFADQVWTLMLSDQGGKSMSAQRRRQYCAREDRIEIILERALKRMAMMFLWAEDVEGSRPKNSGEGKVRGRYWSIRDMVKRRGISRESQQLLKQQLAAGGDVGMKNFIQSHMLDGHAEEIEEMIGKPIGGTKYTQDKLGFAANMCSVMVPVCSKRSFEDQGYENDEVYEEADGRTFIARSDRLFPFDPKPDLLIDDYSKDLRG